MSEVYRIITNFFRKDHPEKTRRAFTHWFFSFSSKEKDEALYRLWDNLQVKADASTRRSFCEVAKRLEFPGRKKIRLSFPNRKQAAAVLLVPLLSIGLSWLYVHDRPAEEVALVECFVPDGEIRTVVLPDRSEVTINSGSSVFYPVEFKGKNRNVYLSGEAKFTVAPDKKKPFIVKTNDMQVEALGTVFRISSYPDGEKTTASLAEGKIKVDIKSNRESFVLDPEEQIVYDRITRRSDRKRLRPEDVLAWEKGRMVFRSASLYSVINEIERHYGVTVYLNSGNLNEERLTVKFLPDESLEVVLFTLQQLVPGFEYKIKGDTVYIH